jgi:hypothetical protein
VTRLFEDTRLGGNPSIQGNSVRGEPSKKAKMNPKKEFNKEKFIDIKRNIVR